jgi:hypothetical protein
MAGVKVGGLELHLSLSEAAVLRDVLGSLSSEDINEVDPEAISFDLHTQLSEALEF